MNLGSDENNIWKTEFRTEIFYPDDGLDNLNKVEETSFWFRHRNKIITEVIKRFPFHGDFADIGGGNGFQLKSISANFNGHSKYILIEPGYSGCLSAKKYGIQYIYNMPFKDFPFQQFDIGGVGLFDVIEHIEDEHAFLAELFTFLKPGSKIYCTVPAYKMLWSDVDDFGNHFRRYDMGMIKKLASRLHCKLVYSSYFFSYLVPLTFVLRALPYRFGIKRTKEKILREESNQHQPSGFVQTAFSVFEKKELNLISESTCKMGASCIFVLERP